jgi:putative tryptophan/tyrosine transport system substrate-binding protein
MTLPWRWSRYGNTNKGEAFQGRRRRGSAAAVRHSEPGACFPAIGAAIDSPRTQRGGAMMRRREFIAGLGAAAWPLAARAQQPAMPVIGFLHAGSPGEFRGGVAELREGLKEAGYVEGKNVAIEVHSANLQFAKLPVLANDLVRRQVAVIIAAGGLDAAQAARSATSTIPIVVANGFDLVKYGFAESLNRPGGNITGVTALSIDLMGKRVGLLHELLPHATTFAFLSSGSRAPASEDQKNDALSAASAIGLQAFVVTAGSERAFKTAFVTLIERQASALVVGSYAVFGNNANKIVAMAAQHKIPAIYPGPGYARRGGLMSYGSSVSFRQLAVQYVGPILKGAKPADLPIQLATKFEFVVNLKTAEALGLTVPPTLLALADEVIE